jgi:hypothetical protein
LTIEIVDLKLVGVQGIIPHDRDLTAELGALWEKLRARLGELEGISEPETAVGYWHFIDSSTRVYFAGVRAGTLDGFRWDYDYGLVPWAPGPTAFAVAREKNGEEGTVAPGIYASLGDLGYGYDSRFIGDFEVWPLAWVKAGEKPAGDYHEIWIPVVEVKRASP